MHQIRTLIIGTIMSVIISLGISHAGSMSLSPSTGSFGMHCVYPVSFSLNVSGVESRAVDMRVIYSGTNMQLTGNATGQVVYGSYFVRTGTTTVAIDLGRATYGIGSRYRLFNRSDLTTPLTGSSDISYYTRYFQTTTNVLTGNLDFYYSGGWNGDDSNIQSGIVNNFLDVLDSINSGYYNFEARPCILDTDVPLFTGYLSGETRPYYSGIVFTIYDFTGSWTSGYDSTYHYWFSTAPADNTNLANYTSVGANDIDNQYGINSGTILVTLSGLAFGNDVFTGEGSYTGGTLVNTSFTLSTWNNPQYFDCFTSTNVAIGNSLTWNRLYRAYDCILSATGLMGSGGLGLDSNQILLVMITGADNVNYASTNNTGYDDFLLNITDIDNTPPYITGSQYYWTGAFTGTDNYTGAGPLFSSYQQSGWLYWTQNDVEIQLTGNEIFIFIDVLGHTGGDLVNYVKEGAGYSGVYQTLIFTGNMSGTVEFQDIATSFDEANHGQTYFTGGTRYIYNFNVDVFWIDRVATELTGSTYYTGEFGQLNSATVTLTGFATGYDGSIKDDERVIYQFSGVNGAGVPALSGVYDDTDYQLLDEIIFLDNWTGYLLYRDRANNTGEFYVNITGLEFADEYTIIAVPSNRAELSGLFNSGTIARFTFVSGYSSASFTSWTGDIIFSGLVKMSDTGLYVFQYGFDYHSGYSLIFESQSHVSQVMTGLEITGARIFDFTTVGGGELIAGDLLLFEYGEDYLTTGSTKDGEVNASDIGAILAWVQMSGGYQIYSGGFHVWTGLNFVPASPLIERLPFVQYHPGDVNADGDIKSTDIAIINANLDNRSVRTRNDTTFFDIFD